MTNRARSGFDLDLQALSEHLRELADQVEDRNVGVQRVTAAETAGVEEPPVRTLMVRYSETADTRIEPAIEYDGVLGGGSE